MNSKKEVQHVYLVGAKSLGAYGGYETFVYKLTEYHQNKENIKYHVACKANGDGCMDESKFEGVTKINDHEFEFHNELEEKLHFKSDERIKFVGTVYNQELLKKIRENAYLRNLLYLIRVSWLIPFSVRYLRTFVAKICIKLILKHPILDYKGCRQ